MVTWIICRYLEEIKLGLSREKPTLLTTKQCYIFVFQINRVLHSSWIPDNFVFQVNRVLYSSWIPNNFVFQVCLRKESFRQCFSWRVARVSENYRLKESPGWRWVPLSIHLSFSLSVCLYVIPSISLAVLLSIQQSICPSLSLFDLFIHVLVHQFICLSVCLIS